MSNLEGDTPIANSTAGQVYTEQLKLQSELIKNKDRMNAEE
jgi:hypothetical protein